MSAPTPMPSPQSLPAQPLVPATAGPTRAAAVCGWLARAVTLVSLALASYLLVSHFLVQSVKVVGVSMVPTLQDSERYLLNHWIFYLRAPKPSDVVVLRDPLDQGFSVKRVVAVGGDIVYFQDGNVYVNGRRLREPYLAAGTCPFNGAHAKAQSFKFPPE